LQRRASEKNAHLTVFEGTYTQLRQQKEAVLTAAVEARLNGPVRVPRSRPERPSLEERKRANRLKEIEAQIAELEQQLANLGRQLENPPPDPARVQHLGGEYVRVQNEMEGLMSEWEGLQNQAAVP